MDSLRAIKYTRGTLDVLDQLRLPHELNYINIKTCEEAFDCIVTMRVRGAPAIAIVAVLSLAVELELRRNDTTSPTALLSYINSRLDYLIGSRPTAVDLANAIRILKQSALSAATQKDSSDACHQIRAACIQTAEKMLEDDLATNLAIGKYGAEYVQRQLSPTSDNNYPKPSVLTHCNTGSLATSGHGTALGIIRSLYTMDYLRHVYFTETRPYNQGSRLTAYELLHESIPSTLITDSMAGALFARKKDQEKITAVIVGADRVARNGDTANKIGTYSLAILARHHGIKFVVAAPTTSIDLRTETGADIQIENRDPTEMTQISGAVIDKIGRVESTHTVRVAIADQRVGVWNPAFDVTPAALIDAIITERGEVLRNSNNVFDFSNIIPERRQCESNCLGDKIE
ncbi:Methylthioribose-1-phosphate isomerase [Golovinomyces cichoracearum]|uniref:Methylthioribose-1-phosphate isomerase n=1 Tax=Golovinomyces cichoracearum TaxID=62708 RepID=A0A420IVM2_9PEZI|nr:Methylthioribose-1-phosphate isomerase [Golovinomyces cichoracearum]